jgi:hypothetical protein
MSSYLPTNRHIAHARLKAACVLVWFARAPSRRAGHALLYFHTKAALTLFRACLVITPSDFIVLEKGVGIRVTARHCSHIVCLCAGDIISSLSWCRGWITSVQCHAHAACVAPMQLGQQHMHPASGASVCL